jgi:multiple sugar transport system substrate-binding protein
VMSIAKRYLCAALALVVAALALTACGGGDSDGGGDGGSRAAATETVSPDRLPPATITVWSWDPVVEQQAEAFTRAFPHIRVRAVNAGVFHDEYNKFRSSLKAGSGGPDALLLTNDFVGSFAQTDDILSLTEAGISAEQINSEFPEWAVEIASHDGGIYVLPGDGALMSFLYRPDALERAGVEIPRTWDEFAAAARKLHDADPESYLTGVPTNAADWFFALMAQNGWKPFRTDGENIAIAIDSPEGLRVADYWAQLVSDGVAIAEPWYTNGWISAMSTGTYSGWVSADWGPAVVSPGLQEAGRWRAALLPKWDDDDGYPSWGPGGYAVSAQSRFPEQAAAFAHWVAADRDALRVALPYSYPPAKVLTTDPAFINKDLPFYGPQKANKVYIEAAQDPNNASALFEYSALYAYALGRANALFSRVLAGDGSMDDALATLQAQVVAYAKQQGYTVTEG